ncbi:DEAD/DEAH box helicase family protein [Mucilaginibacter sp. RS28]|uniref:DEAD/DEAH box helicase family protein n=1 Tax=Mucilaginibacter straminoryzae TaxID=2932774 RepID=A0A9X1X3U9_9SPHI|nr:DEAD/DEAH box helicase family protein [Mucilaginibacter straminoryzae]MCJ8210657.1 DEAD/DEAH box helicase family protein [Mucilaginibacter straminoryzae]
MELKPYQQKVILDLDAFLGYLQKYKKTDRAFNQFWEDRIGPYNPLVGQGMEPYKNTIANAAHVCIKVPTAGGKTFIACNALHTIFSHYPDLMPKMVVWLVPWSNLLGQTVANLSNPDHPYRQKLNSLFNHRVAVYEQKDLRQAAGFNPAVVKEQLSILVMSFASLRARNKEDRKVYQENGYLAPFASQYVTRADLMDDVDETALINVIRTMQPVVVVDESHNAESALSVDMLKALNPSFVLDLTATPKNNSNIISLVPAIELKKENMVKLPVIVYNHHDKTQVISSALHLQRKLELLATEQEQKGGPYIRPIVLFQAQPRTGEENVSYERLKQQLLQLGIPENQVKIKTATLDELKGEDLLSRKCAVRYIITVNALKEGWDCPFAYVLASLADKSSAVDVEQILGRVLRQPYVRKQSAPLLNVSYVLTASAKFNDTLQNIVKGLQSAGFSSRDYREVDLMTEREEQALRYSNGKQLTPDLAMDAHEEPDIDIGSISFNHDLPGDILAEDKVVADIQAIADEQAKAMEQVISRQKLQPADDRIFEEMGDKVKRYRMSELHRDTVADIKLPQFHLHVPQNTLFGTGLELLSQEPLLRNFKLSSEDIKIDFEQIASDLYRVDIEETGYSQYDARFTRIEEAMIKEPVVTYILSKPQENRVKDIAHQLIRIIGDMYPIPDQEIRIYIERILGSLDAEQLQDILLRKQSYADKIKLKIKQHADAYAEERFNDLIKIGKVVTQPAWHFSEMIVPGITGASISKSLYEREGAMNDFETSVIETISALPNISFWHRNLGRGKGFCINGYQSNHYPDFIVGTRLGRIVLIETKGDDRDNSDSQAKCRLGNKWEELAGDSFRYFMVFNQKQLAGAYTKDRARELIREL